MKKERKNCINIKTLVFFFLFFFSFSFSNEEDEIITIDLTKSIEGDIPMSIFFNDVEYIKLETTKECLLVNPSIYVTDSYIIASNVFKDAYLFDRKTGKFIHEISRYGQGPDDYLYSLGMNGFNEKYKLLFFYNFDHWRGIDIETNKLKVVVKNPAFLEKYNKENKYRNINLPHILNDSIFIGYTNNVTGRIPYLLILFNKDGEVLKEFPNYVFHDHIGMELPFNQGIFYAYNNNLYFKDQDYNDTIYKIEENKLTPHIVFNLGDKKPKPPTTTTNIKGITIADINNGKWYISYAQETKKYVFFKYEVRGGLGLTGTDNSSFSGYYDKKTQQVYTTNHRKNSGYINDLDNFLDFRIYSSNNNGEFFGAIEAEKITDYMKKNKNNPIWSKINNITEIQEDDNPIVVIAKIRE